MALYWKVPHYSHFSIYETTPERMMNQMIFKWIQSAISLTHALARLQQSLSRQILRSRIGSPWANTGPVLYTTRTLLLLLGSINKNILLHIHLPQRFCAFLSMPLNEKLFLTTWLFLGCLFVRYGYHSSLPPAWDCANIRTEVSSSYCRS